MSGDGRKLRLTRKPCEACNDSRVLQLVAHWTALDIGPACVACPHCSYPWLPIHTYYPRKAS